MVDWILADRSGESHDQVTGKPIKILAGIIEQHINPDIAFAVNRYAEATGDGDFLFDMGAEIVCEMARLYLDLGFYNENKGRLFCINEVTGQGEYNALVNNNAYTNLMAAEKIGLKDHEAQEWRRAAENIFVPRDEKTGLIWQDDGFMNRKPWPLDSIQKENFPLLLGDRFTREEKETAHG